jgi:hypothetical protein
MKEECDGPSTAQDPPEGSHDVIDRELERRRQREQNKVDHLPGVKVSGQPQGGAVERAQREERIRTRAHQIWEDNGRPEGCSDKFWLEVEQELDGQQAS